MRTGKAVDDMLVSARLRRDSAAAVRHVRAIELASAEIVRLGVELDDQLSRESRPAERMRMLRATTNRITRRANDAIDAYRKGKQLVTAARATQGDIASIDTMARRLAAARLELLRVLSIAETRYPPPATDSFSDLKDEAGSNE
jgi:hypothetical protein